ncbi:MAG TPA: FHA domain-containing protein [Streptosporangiaceae bacterium]
MTDPGEAMRRPLRAPMPRRRRRRWAVAAAVAACWAVAIAKTGSIVAGTVLMLLVAALGTACVLGLRAMGVGAAHPWVQGARSRPWRDGQDVLQLGLRHLPDVFVITPGGSLLAPNSVELWLNPRDFISLCELMDIDLVDASASEVYQEQVGAHGARFARPGAAEVRVIGDPSVPAGRYRLRQARPLDAAPALEPAAESYLVPAGGWPYAHDGDTRGQLASAGTVVTGLPTVAERGHPPVPALRLVTGSSAAQTQLSGARAGRGDVELPLPEIPTVSREHAEFTYAEGQWWITNLGRNGLTLNGVPLEGQRPVRDGDSIRWGSNGDAPVSRVEVG